ncbi:hypothetical protein OJF2_72460 [Aquisphaera giovannonii]|uniref:Uncharacterized protein n=1 Tax=Aquisphaera giovannonii TaxID=406548 RepID=A0A5B9WFH7_9BACT|nr:hypothetical protein [Aquisphaera giovannonii]QEH38640.1 hypothetical protein OJF2_72460 [Aquisphaera giovannonii]
MPFDQSSITDVRPPVWDGSALHLEWSSTAPDGTYFQVYVGRVLSWYGTSRWVAVPMPTSRVRIDIGAVGPGEQATDFGAMLATAPADRAYLSWLGGSYLDPSGDDDIAGFRIYGEIAPGVGIDYTDALDEIPAYPGGILTDGFGLGGFGLGGFGRAASSYEWTSQSLRSGTWSFAVVSFDAAGNCGTPAITSATIQSPPRPPAAFPDGTRLKASYDPTTRRVTLNWLESPS